MTFEANLRAQIAPDIERVELRPFLHSVRELFFLFGKRQILKIDFTT